jgi:hypothetical protein
MLKWLAKQFGTGADDPDSLGSERGLQNFIDSLPLTVPARTLEAIGEQFEKARSLELPPARLAQALKRLDERAQAPLAAVTLALFADELGRELSDASWMALTRFYRNLHVGYRVCLPRLSTTGATSAHERSDAVLLGCRAMAALGRYKTLLRMRYRDVEHTYWEQTLELASWAASIGGAHTLVELYPGGGYQSSVERELLIGLLFEVAPIPNLLPAQMAALDTLLRRFAANYQSSDAYRETTPFVLDASSTPVARRWLKGLKPRPGQRFFGVGGAYAQLAALAKQARTSSELPEWLAPVRLEPDAHCQLLDLLLSHWSTQPPQRRQRRNQAQGEILVTHGVAQVRRMLAASEYAKGGGQLSYEDNTPYDYKLFDKTRFGSVDQSAAKPATAPTLSPLETLQKFELEGDRQMTERWNVSDVSTSGLGAVAVSHAGWARIGMLLGFRSADSLDWQLAVVRRLSRSPRGRLSVGLETIAGRTWCARIRIGAGDSGNTWVAVAGTSDIYHDAVLLLNGEEPATLLVEQGTFTVEIRCLLSFDKRWHPAKLERVIDNGYDYERIQISLLTKTDAP